MQRRPAHPADREEAAGRKTPCSANHGNRYGISFPTSASTRSTGRSAKQSGLPPFVYTSQEFFEFEQRELFRRSWMGVCFAHQVPEPGDAIPLSVARIPVIVVRGKSGDVRAFHNVCRHRGTKVLLESEKAMTRFRCIYHSWTYDIDGSLLTTPFWDSEKGRQAPADLRVHRPGGQQPGADPLRRFARRGLFGHFPARHRPSRTTSQPRSRTGAAMTGTG